MQERFGEMLFLLKKTATDLAREIDVSRTTISKIMSGENQPSSKILIPLGEKLNININWLLFGVGEMFMDSAVTGDSQKNKTTAQGSVKDCEKEIKQLKQQLKDKDSLIEEKNKQIIEAKDEIIKLLKTK
jgi:transcriptional regulator with XRE-family HTH domain